MGKPAAIRKASALASAAAAPRPSRPTPAAAGPLIGRGKRRRGRDEEDEDGDSDDSEDEADAEEEFARLRASARGGGAAASGAAGAAARGAKGGSREDAAGGAGPAEPAFKNKEKVLVLCSVGTPARQRHLMLDVLQLLPHARKENKLDSKGDPRVVNELADLRGCSSCIYFETRKRQDLYMWISKAPAGPSAKFLVGNVHTMSELKLAGNHLKGSRPLLTFSAAFESLPHLQLLKEMFVQLLGTPAGHRKCKPFVDHVLSFALLDGRVWLRNYQLSVPDTKQGASAMDLVEVGPRLCLTPIKIFAGSMGGATLYDNPAYVTPNSSRADAKRAKGGKYKAKVKARQRREDHAAGIERRVDDLEDTFAE